MPNILFFMMIYLFSKPTPIKKESLTDIRKGLAFFSLK